MCDALARADRCVHPGLLFHRGQEITQGTRYLLVDFLQDKRRVLVGKKKQRAHNMCCGGGGEGELRDGVTK